MNYIIHVLHTLNALEPQCDECHGTGYRERDTGPVICIMCDMGVALRDQSMRESVPEAWHEMHRDGIRHVRYAPDDMSDEALDWRNERWEMEQDR